MSDRSIRNLGTIEDVQYDARTDTYSVTLNPETADNVGATIAMAVAAITDQYLEDLPPIAHAVDPDSLDSVFQFDQAAAEGNRGCLIFEFGSRRITLYSDRSLVLAPLPNEDPHR
ncbi:HalOD1 output domain-containing protein [Halorientalis salina]|uniref:HalOD1 output domain-containing protein n=1 Tax=Halorientalis salina TaxID=2932266 RepID=UPI0010ACB9C0|nr:HalOD1 output domain-containing protein [Halorientalis salina]